MPEKESQFLDKFIDMLFAQKRYFYYILALTIIGFIFRVIAAINVGVLADDMHFAPGAVGFLSSGKLIYWDQSSGLWFLLTDIFYHLFGTTQLASRLTAVIFGSLTIPLIFLFAKELTKSERIGLFAAILLTFSPFNVKSMMAEMDPMAMCFVVFSLYLFLKAINLKYNTKLFAISGLLMGLGIYTKVYPLLFIPPLILFIFYKAHKEKISLKIPFKKIIIFGAFAFIFCIPALAHNYLLYQDKGIMDHQFSRQFHIEKGIQMYNWISGGADVNPDYLGFFTGNSKTFKDIHEPLGWYMFKVVFTADSLIIILALAGILTMWRRKEQLFLLFFLFFIPYWYLASIQLLIKHYLFVSILAIVPAAIFLDKVASFRATHYKKVAAVLVLVVVCISLILLGYQNSHGFHFYGESETNKMINYKEKNIPASSIVIVDARVYRGDMNWMFNDRHFLEASYMSEFFSTLSNDTTKVPTQIFYIECATDDCGWGTVKNQPEFNASMEEITSFFKNNSKLIATIESSRYKKPLFPWNSRPQPIYRVYAAMVDLSPQAARLADSTHQWWMYPLGYNTELGPIFDKYQTHSFFGQSLEFLAQAIKYLAIISAFVVILGAFYSLLFDLKKEASAA